MHIRMGFDKSPSFFGGGFFLSKELIIGGVKMPTLKKNGLTITKEKVWASNTGRAANGEMIGDLVCSKYKLECEWPPLIQSEVSIIDAAISSAYFTASFIDPASGIRVEKKFYAGTPTYPVYSYANGIRTYSGVKVSLIEK